MCLIVLCIHWDDWRSPKRYTYWISGTDYRDKSRILREGGGGGVTNGLCGQKPRQGESAGERFAPPVQAEANFVVLACCMLHVAC